VKASYPGLLLCQSVRPWYSFPMASRRFSENGGPTTCSATGNRPANPQGSASAGSPARLPAEINSLKPVAWVGTAAAAAPGSGISGSPMAVAGPCSVRRGHVRTAG